MDQNSNLKHIFIESQNRAMAGYTIHSIPEIDARTKKILFLEVPVPWQKNQLLEAFLCSTMLKKETQHFFEKLELFICTYG